jgi:hypothetical protein
MATNPKDPKLAGPGTSPARRAAMDKLIASLTPVKVNVSLRPQS